MGTPRNLPPPPWKNKERGDGLFLRGGQGKRPRERPRRSGEDNIRMDLGEVGLEVVD